MKNEIEIVRNLLEPLLGEEINNLNNNWKTITSGFVLFENDSKPLYTEIYKLETSNPENIISKLSELYQSFVYEMAEVYVLGKENTTTTTLIEQGSSLFSERAAFLKTLKNAITKLERLKIKKEFLIPKENIDLSYYDKNIEFAVKKKARIDLKDKFSSWNKELKKEGRKQKSKVVFLSGIKYAAAAMIIISVGFFFNLNKSQNSETIIANLKESTQKVLVISEIGLGYISSSVKDSILITYKLNNPIKNDNDLRELSLDIQKIKYRFYEQDLVILGFDKFQKDAVVLKTPENKYYLKIFKSYFPLIKGKKEKILIVEIDSLITKQLDRIISEN